MSAISDFVEPKGYGIVRVFGGRGQVRGFRVEHVIDISQAPKEAGRTGTATLEQNDRSSSRIALAHGETLINELSHALLHSEAPVLAEKLLTSRSRSLSSKDLGSLGHGPHLPAG